MSWRFVEVGVPVNGLSYFRGVALQRGDRASMRQVSLPALRHSHRCPTRPGKWAFPLVPKAAQELFRLEGSRPILRGAPGLHRAGGLSVLSREKPATKLRPSLHPTPRAQLIKQTKLKEIFFFQQFNLK